MKKAIIISSVAVVAIGALIAWGVYESKKPGKYDVLAQCIADSGVEFYGAFWCPHCADQKKMFGTSVKLLPYVECSTPDGKGKLPVCEEVNIEGYPTWIYSNTIEFASATPPEMCDIAGTPNLSSTCQKVASHFLKTWVFPDIIVQSETAPVVMGTSYSFSPNSRTGLTQLDRLSEITNCPLPVEAQ